MCLYGQCVAWAVAPGPQWPRMRGMRSLQGVLRVDLRRTWIVGFIARGGPGYVATARFLAGGTSY
jgi:hypothetical protein